MVRLPLSITLVLVIARVPPSAFAQEIDAAGILAEAVQLREKQRAAQLERIEKELASLDEEIRELRRSVGTFEQTEKLTPAPVTALQERWKKERAAIRTSVLGFPEEAQVLILNGKGLNFFLDALGADAEARQFSGKASRLGPNHYIVEQKITADVVRNLNLVVNIPGNKINDDFFDIVWPPILRSGEFDEVRRRFEAARLAAVKDLEKGDYVSNDNMKEMNDCLDELKRKLRALRPAPEPGKKVMGGSRTGEEAEALGVIKRLGTASLQMFKARRIDDVKPPEFPGGTIQDFLAFMHRNNLRFGRVDRNDFSRSRSHIAMAELLRLHYFDLKVLDIALSNNEQRAAELTRQKHRLTDALADPGEVRAAAAMFREARRLEQARQDN